MLDSRSYDGWRRLSRSVTDQAGTDDPAALRQVFDHLAEVQALAETAARRLHVQGGYSWAEIGAELGMTRQAAHKRFSTWTEGS